MCGPEFCSMKIAQEVSEFAARHDAISGGILAGDEGGS
jgi:hypothetical protein